MRTIPDGVKTRFYFNRLIVAEDLAEVLNVINGNGITLKPGFIEPPVGQPWEPYLRQVAQSIKQAWDELGVWDMAHAGKRSTFRHNAQLVFVTASEETLVKIYINTGDFFFEDERV